MKQAYDPNRGLKYGLSQNPLRVALESPVVRIQKFQTSASHWSDRKSDWYKKRRYYFRIRAANGEVVCSSESYNSKASRDRTVRLLLRARMEEV